MNEVSKIVMLPVESLRPYEKNARKHGEKDVAAIAESIKEFGFNDPIGIWGKDNLIVEGHGRLEAAKLLGMDKVPAIRLDHLTDEQRRAYAIAHNRTAELSEWCDEILNAEMQQLIDDGFDISVTGFDWGAVAVLDPIDDPAETNPAAVLDPIDEKPEDLRTQPGDLWQLGDHRLLCGDSSSGEDMDRLFRGDRPDMVFTDPPYGVAIGSKNKVLAEHGNGGGIEEDILGDTLSAEELYKMLVRAFSALRDRCSESCSYYVSSPQGGELGLMMMMMRDAGLPVRHNLIWVKSSAVFSMGRLDYNYRHEPIFYTWTKRHEFRGGYDNTVIDDNQRLEELSKEELKELVHALRGDGQTSVIYCDKPMASKLHPTMKPLKLIQRFVYNSSVEGDTVADIFGGSGSTMIVCEAMKRKCLMMELDPHYCDVIVERWEQFSGKKAVKI